MGMLGRIKKNKVMADFSNYIYTISGKPKSGKTSLVYKCAVEKFGNADNLLLVAFERGYNALNDINAVDIEKYDEFVELVDELVKNKKDLPYKMVALDTVDIMQDLAIPYMLKKASRRDNKMYKVISDVPYGNGWNLLQEVIYEQVNKLVKAGYNLWFITHDEDKTFTTKDGLSYDKTVLSLTGKVRDVCVNMSDFIVYIDTTQRKVDDKIIDERIIRFRGDSTIEAGGRLEQVVESIPYSIKGFIKAVEDAILAEYGGDTKAVEKAKEEQTKDLEERVDRFIGNLDQPEEEPEEPALNKVEAVNTIKANISKLNFADVQNVMKKHGFANFNNPDEIPEEGLLEILKMIK